MNKKEEVDIRTINFNKVDDFRILLLLGDKSVSSLAKEYVLRKYIKRIKKMDFQYLSLLLLEMNLEIIEVCNEFIKDIIENLSYQEVESLVYSNKNYTNVSKLIVSLLNYDWFAKNPKYLMIKEAYELEKIRDKNVSDARIVRTGNKIIGEFSSDHNKELMDMIYKNYLYIIEKNNPDYALEFREKGYKEFDTYLKKDKDITPNMLIFDVYMMKYQNPNKYLVELVFYNNENDSKYAMHVNDLLKINLASLSKVNNVEGDRKFAVEYLFYAISREFMAAYSYAYLKLPTSKRDDLIEELKMHNNGISHVLRKSGRTREHTEHYIHEYCKNVDAIKEVYKRFTLLKSISDKDKYKFNAYISKVLIKSFKSIDRKNSYSTSPVEYVTKEFKKCKLNDNLRSYLLDQEVELSTSLELVEKSLTNLERLELGYSNIYVDALVSISKGEYQVTDIFEE